MKKVLKIAAFVLVAGALLTAATCDGTLDEYEVWCLVDGEKKDMPEHLCDLLGGTVTT